MKRIAALLLLAAVAAPALADPVAGWEVRIPDKLDVAAGATAPLALAIAVDRGLAISRDSGLIVDLTPEPGLAIKRRRLGRTDAIDPDADAPRFAVPIHGEAAGDHKVAVRVRFWLCGTHACRPIDVQRSVVVTVSAPADAPSDHP